MRRMMNVFFFGLFAAGICRADGPETVLVVKLTDHARDTTFRTASREEFQALQAATRKETSLHTKALMAAEKEWKTTEKVGFPRGSIYPSEVELVATFTERGKAETRVQAEEAKATRAPASKTARSWESPTQAKEREKERQAKEAQRDAVIGRARAVYEAKLAELVAAASKDAQPAAGNP